MTNSTTRRTARPRARRNYWIFGITTLIVLGFVTVFAVTSGRSSSG